MPQRAEAYVDRMQQRLRHVGPHGLARLLEASPMLAQAAAGLGPLTPGWPWRNLPPRPPTLSGFAELLTRPGAIDLRLAALDATALQLVQLAMWHDGELTREAAAAAAGTDHQAPLEEAAQRIRDLLLAEDDGWLRLVPGVDEVLGTPGISARDELEYLTVPRLTQVLQHWGRPSPNRKAACVTAVVACLRDADAIERMVRRMSPEVRRVFSLLTQHGPQHVSDLGVPYFWPSTYGGRRTTTLHWLYERGLIGVDLSAQICYVWLDVVVALNGGRLFTSWPTPPASQEPQPLEIAAPTLPPVLERLTALLELWTAQPAEALRSGGIGVRPVRAAAKRLNMDPAETGLLAQLAMTLNLLGHVDPVQGSRRNRGARGGHSDPGHWTSTGGVQAFGDLPAARRWALLVQAWRTDPWLDESEGLPQRAVPEMLAGAPHAARPARREQLLALLADQPDGMGLPEDQLLTLGAWRRPSLLAAERAEHLLAALRALGLVPPTGPVGLTELGRALLAGPGVLEQALPTPQRGFTVQADLTVIAPPDLAPELTATLARYAELESDAGARIYRLSERRLSAAIEAGAEEEQILAFLNEHTTAPLAQNVTYLVRDVAKRTGRVRAGSAQSYLRCDDPAMVARAVAVRAAKLRALAPTVAVSSLARDKLVAALRTKGVWAVREEADGATVSAAPAATTHGGKQLPPVRPPLDPQELATNLFHGQRPSVAPTRSPQRRTG